MEARRRGYIRHNAPGFELCEELSLDRKFGKRSQADGPWDCAGTRDIGMDGDGATEPRGRSSGAARDGEDGHRLDAGPVVLGAGTAGDASPERSPFCRSQ